jgi:gas vesicle protein GvpL/GvpF/DnaJ-like protein
MQHYSIKCAFCKGTGENPYFGQACPVCKGEGTNQITGQWNHPDLLRLCGPGNCPRHPRSFARSPARDQKSPPDDRGRKSPMKNGIYIYGIIKTSDSQKFGNIGISDADEATPVQTIVFREVAAVVSRSPFMVYDSLGKEKIIKDLVTHQFVLERVMEHFTIIPVKFGTMVETEEEASKFLVKGYSLLSNELRKGEEKIELDVVASWELPKILPSIYRHNDQIYIKQSEIARQGNQASMEEKIALGKLIEQSLLSTKADYQQTILQTFAAITLDTRLHDLADEQMIFNGAFLLEKKDEENFNQLINNLDRQLENTVNFRVVGPLPPYSFSTIVLENIDPRKVEEAKEILELEGSLTEKAVRDAYHRQAQRFHPDVSSGEEAEQAAHFPHIHSAYRTLKSVVENGLTHVEIYQWENNGTS